MADTFQLDPRLDTSLYVNDDGAHDDDEPVLDMATAQAITDSLMAAHTANAEEEQKAKASGSRSAEEMADVFAARMKPHANFGKRKLEDGTFDETAPEKDPMPCYAPYDRPLRDDDTPNPLYFEFSEKEKFEHWLDGEDSWCHLVQRRVTTPEKRSMERAKAKEKAKEKVIAGGCNLSALTPGMPEEMRQYFVEPKKRRRNRTSVVSEKITFTCHHAGSYESRHSANLPQHKLRLKTKTSVKCNCPCKVVANVMLNGPVLVTYYWRHEGHDPFGDGEVEDGRLPKILDDWIVDQLKAGMSPEELRKALELKEDDRQRMITAAAASGEPEPNLPPPVAMRHKIKYPDIYNRYRRFNGPIRETKPPKNPGTRTLRKKNAKKGEVAFDFDDANVDAQFEGLPEELDLQAVAEAAVDTESRALGDALASLANAEGAIDDEHAQMTENLIRIAMESQMGAEWVDR